MGACGGHAGGQPVVVDNSQMPIMYGPDGMPISPEEMGFLDGEGCEYVIETNSQPGMDDEALEAYEQFLQETGQK